MVRTRTGGLKGARALYRGKDRYAAQVFENEKRVNELKALLTAAVIGTNVDFGPSAYEVAFNTIQTAYIKLPIEIQFKRLPNSTSRFIVQKNCTCQISASFQFNGIDSGEPLTVQFNVLRNSVNILAIRRTLGLSTDGSIPIDLNFGSFDFQQNDIIYITLSTLFTPAQLVAGFANGNTLVLYSYLTVKEI